MSILREVQDHWLNVVAILVLVAMLACCGCSPPEPARPVLEPVPAQREADELGVRERDSRLALADAEASATFASTAEERYKALSEVARQKGVIAELSKLRAAALALAPLQRQELNERVEANKKAVQKAFREEQAAADRRWALIISAAVCALAAGAGIVLAYIGLKALGILTPVVAFAVCGVGIGILDSGPWLALIAGAAIVLALLAGLFLAGRAIVHSTLFAEKAKAVDPGDFDEMDRLQEAARKFNQSGLVQGLVSRGLEVARSVKSVVTP